MDYPALQLGYNVLQGALTLGLFLYTRRLARLKVTDERFRRLEEQAATLPSTDELNQLRERIESSCNLHQKRTSAVEMRMAKMTVELEHMPTQQHFNELNKSISELNGELRKTQGRLEGINPAVDLINDYLINRERG